MSEILTSKQPFEEYAINFDFTPVLGAENIVSAVVIAIDQDSLEDVSATLLDVTKQSNTTKVVSPWVQNGITGHNYVITCRIVGSTGSQYELDGILPVSEIPSDVGEAYGVSLSSLLTAIKSILQDDSFTDPYLTAQINGAIQSIAAGIRMPDGQISPPLPDLYKYGVVNTSISSPYVLLPVDYQRKVFNISDDTQYNIMAPRNGDYYSFGKFQQQINKLNFSELGSIYIVCIKGNKLYYQGIPSVPYPIGIHYFRKPTILVTDSDIVDAFESCDHLTIRLIKHYVLKEIFGEKIEDGQDNTGIGTKYHTAKFFEAMTDLIDFVGLDGIPLYYGTGNENYDRGVCD